MVRMRFLILSFSLFFTNVVIGQKSFEKASKEIDSLLKKATNKNPLDIKKSFLLLNQALELAEETKNYDKEISVINELCLLYTSDAADE